MQRKRARVHRNQPSAQLMEFDPSRNDFLECTEEKGALGSVPKSAVFDRREFDASAETREALLPLQPLQSNSLATAAQRQIYIGSSHCPIDGWYQACR